VIPVRRRPASHLAFLDGIRALAALWVVASHAFTLGVADHPGAWYADDVPAGVRWVTHVLCYGYHGVPVFIVLSGFLLMRQVVTTPDGRTMTGGVREFFVRRGWRILPAYYAALVMSVVLLFAGHASKARFGMAAHQSEYAINASVGSIGSHVLLVHNLVEAYNKTLDAPMWSVAAEWQIYGLFAVLLLPIWRKAGDAATVSVAFGLGAGLLYLLPAGHNLSWTCPWYIGLFAMGMTGAAIAEARPADVARTTIRSRVPWMYVAFAIAALVFGTCQFAEHVFVTIPVPLIDTIIGLGTVCTMVACSLAAREHGAVPATRGAVAPSWVMAALQSRFLVGIAAFSYSLYLVHFPFLDKLTKYMASRHMGYIEKTAILFLVGVPAVTAFAYGFYLVIEKPAMDVRRRRNSDQRAPTAPSAAGTASPPLPAADGVPT
jgi:peptidoglycan/LPS O-acetylase OafA/YrhL